MNTLAATDRVFLFLQGPHGPFFDRLARMVRRAGSTVWRAGFNAGDAAFWSDRGSYIPFCDPLEEWPEHLAQIITDKGATDIVLYGDTRPIHASAIKIARDRKLRVHVFEEGYLRPYWVTYERDGANGHSRLMGMNIPQMQKALEASDMEAPLPPAHWGDTRQHIFYGALYHGLVMFSNRAYRHFRPHRALSVGQEFRLYLRRLLLMPLHAIDRLLATRRIRRCGAPYHVALLQLEHDSAFRDHSPFSTMTEFIETVIDGFARGAPQHHHLVFKAHPLEDGRVPLRREIRRLARAYGLSDRVHYVRGNKLAALLRETRSAVTVNSTAAQQVLWRGIPLKVFGNAVYDQPEFVSDLPLTEFFARATRPDTRAYRDYRRYLLETSQLPGGFYSANGRRQLLRHVVDVILADEDPYDALASGTAAPRQQLRLVG